MGIKMKRSSVAGKVPVVGDLELGELGVNTRDGKLFLKKNVSGTESIVEIGPVVSVAGKSGAVTLAKADVGLGNVDNTSDASKPISSATQTALDAKLDDSQASVFGLSLLDDADAATARNTLGLGTAATRAVGTGANQVVALDASARLPAVDGSLLTNLPIGAASGRLLREPQFIISSGSYVVLAGCTRIIAECVGGGGGGGAADGTDTSGVQAAGGGGAGGYCMRSFAVTPGQSCAVVIGNGGAGGDTSQTSGLAGGNTTFTAGGVTITANGGSGGQNAISAADAVSAGGFGGAASGGEINHRGERGYDGYIYSSTSRGGGAGGSSRFGLGGSFKTAEGPGLAATLFRGGGGGGGLNIDDTGEEGGGAGASGAVLIWEFS